MNPHTSILKSLRSVPMSLADLQQATQVSLPTLRKAVQELTDARWIRIVGQAEANGGRPPNMFGLDSSYYSLIGLHLQLPGVHLITTDLNGQVLHERRLIQNSIPLPDDVLSAVRDYVQHVREILPERQILGIGVAAPGFIDPESGDILLIGRVPGWENFPICSRLRTQTGLMTRIANDVDSMAFAEFHSDGLAFHQNLIYVGFDEGVKASLFLNGELYKGSLGNAGLIASSLLHVDTRDDDVRDKQEVLSIHGVNAIFDRRLNALPEDKRAPYRAISAIDDPRQRFEYTLRCAAAELPVCGGVIQLMNQTLAAAIANLILIIQPDVFVLGGALGVMPLELFADLEMWVRAALPRLISHKVMIRLGKAASPTTAAVGAAHYFFEQHLMEHPEMLLQPQHARL